jgi:dTDP-4-dehydrorhamnose reductase
MKVVILGPNGMLGSMLVYYLKTKTSFDIIPVARNVFDALAQPVSVLENIISNTDYVINCIGAIPQKLYTNEEYEKLNTMYVHDLAKLCDTLKIKLIHISTNCVFSGKQSNCVETDIPDAADIYGKSKYAGEPANAMTVRCSIIGPEKETCFGLMEWFLNNNSDSVFGYEDSYWNGLTTLELSKTLVEIINNYTWHIGVKHFYSESTLSKCNILHILNYLFNKNKTIIARCNGEKYYTLYSKSTTPRKSIEDQLLEIKQIYIDYKLFNNILL